MAYIDETLYEERFEHSYDLFRPYLGLAESRRCPGMARSPPRHDLHIFKKAVYFKVYARI
jgi:hypothetical protein